MRLPSFTALAACDPLGFIGNKGTLPWHCPEELLHFRNTTLHQTMVMGYKTYLSMPKRAFEHRTSIVFSINHSVDPKLALQVKNFEELADLYSKNKSLLAKTQFLIGGAEIFEHFFAHDLIEHALISHMRQEYRGDTLFPLHHLSNWTQTPIEEKPAYSLVKYTNLSFSG